MRRPLKIFGIVVGILLLVVVALAIAVPLLFDINEYKGRIAAEVEQRTGRELTIDGDLQLTVFPWLGVRTSAMSLSQPDGFDDSVPFASFQRADIRVRLLPLLLRRDIELGRVALEGLQLQLERDADGRDNWSDLTEARADAPTEPPPDDADAFDLERIDIEGIALTDARLAFRDAHAGTSYIAEGVNLRTGRIRAGEPVELSLDARVSSGVPQWRGTVSFSGQVQHAPDDGSVAAAVERAEVDLEGGALPFARLHARVAARVEGNLESERWRVEGLELTATARGGALPDRDVAARFTGALDADLQAQTAALKDFRIEAAGVRAALAIDATGVVDDPAYTGRLTVDPFSPRELLTTLGIELPATKDPSALSHAELAADVAGTGASVTLRELRARVDASAITGSFGIADFERQALRFDLAVDELDADRYLPPDSPEADEVPASALDDVRVPSDAVRALDVEGDLRVGRMRAAGIASEEIHIAVRARDGLVRVHPSTARLYGGRYTGDIRLDVRGERPQLSMNERLRGIQAGPLFDDLFGNARITGTADLQAELSATGNTIGEMRPTLAGGVSFGFQDGAVTGFDLWHMIGDARAVLRGEPRPPADGENRTEFGSLSGSGTVRQGVLTTDNLRARLPFLTVAGQGTMNVVDEAVDFRLQVTVQRVPGVDGTAGAGELTGRTIPVRISGPVDDLSYGVDIAAALREELRERAEEEIQERLRDRLRRIIP